MTTAADLPQYPSAYEASASSSALSVRAGCQPSYGASSSFNVDRRFEDLVSLLRSAIMDAEDDALSEPHIPLSGSSVRWSQFLIARLPRWAAEPDL